MRNNLCGSKWSGDQVKLVTPMLRAEYLEKLLRRESLITRSIVCCEAIRSAILATAWLLVLDDLVIQQ